MRTPRAMEGVAGEPCVGRTRMIKIPETDGHEAIKGFRTLSPGNRPTSRSAVHNSSTPCWRHRDATLAS